MNGFNDSQSLWSSRLRLNICDGVAFVKEQYSFKEKCSVYVKIWEESRLQPLS